MASTGVVSAKAPDRMIVGPFQTSAGFQYWYMACLPDSIVAIPQGIGTGLLLAMSNSVAPLFGLLGALLVHFLAKSGKNRRLQIEGTLARTPVIRLREKPNSIYPVSQVRSIVFKCGKFAKAGTLFVPDIILELSSGKKKTFGIMPPDYDKACAQLKQMYPHLCQ